MCWRHMYTSSEELDPRKVSRGAVGGGSGGWEAGGGGGGRGRV